MTGNKLRIGKMAYANLFPLFYMLQNECDCSEYEFIEGFPSDLNRRICLGEIDVSPSSSIEYLRNSSRYTLIGDHSISSLGPIKSIFLFSRKPIEELNGETILTTSQSETSVALLRIILKKFYRLECPLESSSEALKDAIKSHPAYMLIGDEAMKEAAHWKQLHQYDLGELWYKYTGLPMTFALWIARKDLNSKERLLVKFTQDLDRSKKSALEHLGIVAAASPLRHLLSEKALIKYWEGISYDFTEAHKKGLALFRQYSEDLGTL